jgi:4-amino-4-deoxy-L-arabinose transferase-like glycosyltransferase
MKAATKRFDRPGSTRQLAIATQRASSMDQYASTVGLSPVYAQTAGVRARRRIYRLAIIFAAAFFVRMLVMLLFKTYHFESEWDYGYEYARMARWILLGHGFSSPYSETPIPSAMMAPIYVYFMAAIFSVTGMYSVASAVLIEIVQTIIAAVTCLIFYRLGTKMFNEQVGLLSAVALALYPPAIFFSVSRIEPVVLIVLLLGLIVHYLRNTSEDHCYQAPMVCGFLMGLAALVEPTIITFALVGGIWVWLFSSTTRLMTVKRLMLITICFVGTVLPWTVRNYFVFGRFVPIKAAFGLNLLEGNNPYGDGVVQYTKGFYSVEEREKIHGTRETPEQLKRKEILSEAEREEKRHLNEVDADKLMFRKSMEFIKAQPERFLQLTARRIFAFWSPVNLYRTTPYDALRGIVYGVPLILALAGLILARNHWRETSLIALFFFSYPLSYYVTHVSMYRYRYPVEPFLILMSCYAVAEIAKKITGNLSGNSRLYWSKIMDDTKARLR